MDKKKNIEYKHQYTKNNYSRCEVTLRDKESAILAEFSENLGLSKNALLQKCLVYCYNEMIDVSSVKLSSPDKLGKTQD